VEYRHLSGYDKEVYGAENVTLSGKFLSKVYEGDFERQKNGAGTLKVMREAKGLQSGNGICGMLPVPEMPEIWGKLCCYRYRGLNKIE
jgi:hypothetical protein